MLTAAKPRRPARTRSRVQRGAARPDETRPASPTPVAPLPEPEPIVRSLPDADTPPLLPMPKRIVIGVEIEAYSIQAPEFSIGRRHSRPRPGVSEAGERYTRDTSIGSEYNSRPFGTIREAVFLLKSGLRKYLRRIYRGHEEGDEWLAPLLVGGWTNRFAGTHLHLSLADEELTLETARSLAGHLHAHVPLMIAACANSPIWGSRITATVSNRLERGSEAYFKAISPRTVSARDLQEMRYAPARKRKPATLELRMLDSNIPEFVVATLTLAKAVTLRWRRGRRAVNRLKQTDYLGARHHAGRHGMRGQLCWRGEWIPARKYLDRFLWEHRAELEEIDIPDDVYDVLRLLKRGYNGARLIHDAARIAYREHPQTWQRRFARRYAAGIELLLSGNSLRDFAAALNVALPDTDQTWLGRRTASIDE